MRINKRILLIMIVISCLLMSIGYASINSISFDVDGNLVVQAQDGVFITEVNYVSNSSASIGESNINGFSKTTLNSKVVLSSTSSTSSITYRIKVYNSNNEEYKFKTSKYDENFYSNSDIVYELSNISKNDVIASKGYIEFDITFHYKNYSLGSSNILNSYINFEFVPNVTTGSEDINNKYNPDNSASDIDLDNMTSSEKSDLFGNISSGKNVYVTTGINGDKVTILRGNYTDNYVSFGGYVWRILQIDSNGNLRLIMDNVINTTSTYRSSSSATSESAAQELLSYTNSDVKTVLDSWYNTNLSSYSDKIVKSKFCVDLTSYTRTSSGTSSSVYYFQSYENIGKDSSNYSPNLACPSNYIIEENIGLISAEEVVWAGGKFVTSNTNYFLYNSSITSSYWTLSPAYYDPNLQNANVFIMNSDGTLTDWESGLLTNNFGIRPVITINGNFEMSGDGTKSNPYTYLN